AGPAKTAASNFAGELAKKLSDYAIASAITERNSQLAFALKVMGLLDWQYVEAGNGPLASGYVRKRLRLDRFQSLISDPAAHFKQTLHWGDNNFDPLTFFTVAREFFGEEASIEIGTTPGGHPYIQGCMRIEREPGNPPGLAITMFAATDADENVRVPFTEDWGLGVSSTFRMVGGIEGKLRPPMALSLKALAGSITGDVRVFIDRNPDKRPFEILGGTGLVTIGATNMQAGLGLRADWNAGTKTAKIDPLFFADIEGLTLKIGTDNADSFIGSLLAALDIEGEFDLGLEWTAETGLRVKASGGIEIALPIHQSIGPVELQTVYFALRIKPDGALSTEISTAIAGKLGPIGASVDRIGAMLDFRFADGTEGKNGAFDVGLSFKPPNGIGLSVDAGVVVGGGYLYIDAERGEYAGALELTFSGFLSLKAIGLITTKMPDGSSGFSMLIIITADFGTGIQLGYGFTLLAVGGLVGVNRTMRLQALMEGVRSNAIESVMFPKDIIANAPKIISDLRNFFPPQQDLFLIGPMAKLGWGTPTLISVALGVIIEIPGNIAILGVLKVVLPTEDLVILKLQVNFAGAIEFDKKRLFFFAALFDSRVLFLTIEGEMGLLVAWGDDANFVVSVGGFHPSFTPPPLPFPSPVRIAVSLINTSWARVRVEGYFAVTSNTVQFGSRTELFFGFDAINVNGHWGWDALFQFSPFYFIIQGSASFSLEVFGAGLFSVHIRGSLEGPTPWRAAGTGSISLLFFDVSADFDVTWGESQNTQLPPIQVMPLLVAEMNKRENWTAQLPKGNNLLVSMRKLPEDDSLVLHPVGTLKVTQRRLPLELTMDKVGNQKPSDVKRVSVTLAPGPLAKKADTFEKFAPAQFQNFDDSKKLSRPAYAPEKGGLEISSSTQDLASAKTVKRVVRYEEIILDTNFRRFQRKFFKFAAGLFAFFLKGSAITKSDLSMAGKKKLDPFNEKVEIQAETYTVALQANNKAWSAASASFHSEAAARDFMNMELAKDPALADTLHVIPSYEKAA
ncbi:MAG TPA: DUF6603 domain-containing protein, partial [Thermoanaerobaculia bacterium]|nr:DUF6603 domain-containing protein [Thermoanaerobaculia bacterium]